MEPPAEAPPPPQPAPSPEEAYRCHRCGAPHDPYQEYCLECGVRLAHYPRGSWVSRRDMWTRQSPVWFWLMLLALLALVLVGGAIVLAATDDDAERPRQAARPTTSVLQVPTAITTSTLPTVTAAPTATATVPTFATTTTDGATTGRTTTGRTTTGGTGTVIAWPSGKRGYTVVLASVPTSRGRPPAEQRAEEAIDDGLSEVGVLDSSDYASLNPGYYVVFTGIHDTLREAQDALPDARTKDYPLAYVREIKP